MSTAQRPNQRQLAVRARRTPVAWLAHVELTQDEWLAQGVPLGVASRSSNWWLGDWVRFGKNRYGAKYEEAAEVTGYDVQTLTNMVYVASRFEFSRRRENLSWSVHAELAALEQDEQDYWLGLAASTPLSVRALRAQLREHHHAPARDTPPESGEPTNAAPEPLTPSPITCPNCGVPITWAEALPRASGAA
jgi:hypothetical protein